MNAKRKFCWGWVTAIVALGGLWASGIRLGGGTSTLPPLEVQAHRLEREGHPVMRISVRNTGSEPLYAVEIFGLGEEDSMRLFRRDDWAPGEVVVLGGREGWMSGASATVEVSARGYASRKMRF
jgi:hypothetical protein